MKINMELKELEDYLGITDNTDYMAKAELIKDFRVLEKLISNMNNFKEIEIIRKDDFFMNGLHYDNIIVYEYNNLIVYKSKKYKGE